MLFYLYHHSVFSVETVVEVAIVVVEDEGG